MRTALLWLLLLLAIAIPFAEAPKNILFGLAVAVWLAQRGWRMPAGTLAWLGLFVFVAVLAAITAITPREGFNGAFDFLRIFLCGLMAVTAVTTERVAWRLLTVAAAATAAAAAAALLQVKLGYANFGSAGLGVFSLGFANHSATYLALALVAQLIWLQRHAVWDPRRLRTGLPLFAILLLVVLPTLAALWYTSSRGAWVAVALLVVFYLLRFATCRLCLALLLGVLLAVPVLSRSQMPMTQLLYSVRGVEMNWRVAMWRDCAEVVRERPWFGVGPRNFKYQDPERYVRTWAYSDHAHNVLVNIATETGLVGLAAFLLFLGALLRDALRQPLPWCFLTQGAVLVLVVAGMATSTFHTEGGMLFALLVGTALGASRAAPAA